MLDIIVDGKTVMSTSDDGKDTIKDQATLDMFTEHMSESEKAKFIKDRNIDFIAGDVK